jgi:hypothetical protein
LDWLNAVSAESAPDSIKNRIATRLFQSAFVTKWRGNNLKRFGNLASRKSAATRLKPPPAKRGCGSRVCHDRGKGRTQQELRGHGR